MNVSLLPVDFSEFFYEVHGFRPFPWQTHLVNTFVETGKWPDVVHLPTGAGKTSLIDIAVFCLALEAEKTQRRRAPVRIAFVVDRRLVVDDAFRHAVRLADGLRNAKPHSVTAKVAARLNAFARGDTPLVVQRLRGGVPREHDWARTPLQPTVLCSTIDQIGSRLLFRGYGVSDRMKPVHAGLLGADCHVFLDEAHLAEAFRQTLERVAHYNGTEWREVEDVNLPWGYTVLTATPRDVAGHVFELTQEDHNHPILSARCGASKPVMLIQVHYASKPARRRSHMSDADQAVDGQSSEDVRVAAMLDAFRRVVDRLRARRVANPAVGIVVNRVARARAIFTELRKQLEREEWSSVLLIGPSRPLDRDAVVETELDPIRTMAIPATRELAKPLLVVATQCIEVGVDIDLDGLITEVAPLDALRQRFGRLNRGGRPTPSCGAIVALHDDVSMDADDPVYGRAGAVAWDYLVSHAKRPLDEDAPVIDFGLNAFDACVRSHPIPDEALSPRADAPVLLPAHIDLLSYTSPVPVVDPEVSLFLHGPHLEPDAVTVIWRADVEPDFDFDDRQVRTLLGVLPPRATEAIQIPVWAVRRWLMGDGVADAALADVPARIPDARQQQRQSLRRVFRWMGDDEGSRWIQPDEVRPGDTIIVPASYGGVDEFGWNPSSCDPVFDLGVKANEPFAGSYFAVRVAPGLVVPSDEAKLAAILALAETRDWKDIRDELLELSFRDNGEIRAALAQLDYARGRVECLLDVYGFDAKERPRGVVFLARGGLRTRPCADPGQPSTEHEGLVSSVVVGLEEHCHAVAETVEKFARCVGLPEQRVRDLKLAGMFHDIGKANFRYQLYLAAGDYLELDPDHPLAKSGRRVPYPVWSKVGLPEHWRHEAFSVQLASRHPAFSEATDPELVLWLIGTHHGFGRPFFPHAALLSGSESDERLTLFGAQVDVVSAPGPESLAYDWQGLDWPALYERLKARYGLWALAYMEAILRLADHRVSAAHAWQEEG